MYSNQRHTPFLRNVLTLFNVLGGRGLSPSATHLYMCLLYMMNLRLWPEWLEVSDRAMASFSHLGTRTLQRARQELAESGALTFRTEGMGRLCRILYSIPALPAAWPGGAGGAVSVPDALPNDSAKVSCSSFKETERKESSKEKEREEVPPSGLVGRLEENRAWAEAFCRNKGLTAEALHGHLVQFVQHLQNRGCRGKTVDDGLRHFVSWFEIRERIDQQHVQEQAEAQRRLLERRREEERAEERHRAELEERAARTWESTRQEILWKAEHGDEYARSIKEKYGL